MEAPALFSYVFTLATLTLAPGPLVAVLAARSANKDQLGACAFALGICVGDVLVVCAVCTGLGFWLEANPQIFVAARCAGVTMLLWMAFRMWNASPCCCEENTRKGRIAASGVMGLALCLSSPQTVVMYLVLLPQVADLAAIGINDMLMLILATVVALLGVFIVVILFADATQRLLHSSKGERLWSRGMSLAVASSALYVFIM